MMKLHNKSVRDDLHSQFSILNSQLLCRKELRSQNGALRIVQNSRYVVFAIIVLIGLFQCNLPLNAKSEPTPNPVRWSLKASSKIVSSGDQFTAHLTAQIAKGWHLYSLDEVPNGPRPTLITLASQQLFEMNGEIVRPTPITKFDENFGVDTHFYESSVSFALPIKISASAKRGTTNLIVQTRYQVCNEEMCLPPKTVKVATTIKIK